MKTDRAPHAAKHQEKNYDDEPYDDHQSERPVKPHRVREPELPRQVSHPDREQPDYYDYEVPSQYSRDTRGSRKPPDRDYIEQVDHPLEEGHPKSPTAHSATLAQPSLSHPPQNISPIDLNAIWAMFWIADARLTRVEIIVGSILTAIQSLSKQEKRLMAGLLDQLQPEMQNLTDELQHNSDTEDSAAVAINTLIDKVNALVQNATDIATLKADMATWSDTVKQHVDPLAAAIANVPSS